MKLRMEDLTPAHWPAIESLFGPRGACGGCWCMYRIVEAYPVNPRSASARIPAAFAYTGTTVLFARAGFAAVGNVGGGRVRMRRRL